MKAKLSKLELNQIHQYVPLTIEIPRSVGSDQFRSVQTKQNKQKQTNKQKHKQKPVDFSPSDDLVTNTSDKVTEGGVMMTMMTTF